MTEAEWRACAEPHSMLEFLRQPLARLTARKWRLFGIACCHRIEHFLMDERSRRAVAVAERFADGEATDSDLDEAFEAAFDVGAELLEEKDRNPLAFVAAGRDPLRSAAWAASNAAHPDESADGVVFESAQATVPAVEQTTQCTLLRCLFGNPFRELSGWVARPPANVVALAEAIYKGKTFDHLPFLADALEDAGCDNADILNHCRSTGPHVRGCWVIDLLLGKE